MDVASGTLISYATKDGSVALDNSGASGANSPYAKALLEHLGEPLDITLVLRKVRGRLLKVSLLIYLSNNSLIVLPVFLMFLMVAMEVKWKALINI